MQSNNWSLEVCYSYAKFIACNAIEVLLSESNSIIVVAFGIIIGFCEFADLNEVLNLVPAWEFFHCLYAELEIIRGI